MNRAHNIPVIAQKPKNRQLFNFNICQQIQYVIKANKSIRIQRHPGTTAQNYANTKIDFVDGNGDKERDGN